MVPLHYTSEASPYTATIGLIILAIVVPLHYTSEASPYC